jgi:hypothetical protein
MLNRLESWFANHFRCLLNCRIYLESNKMNLGLRNKYLERAENRNVWFCHI